jgi:hypothetical protein
MTNYDEEIRVDLRDALLYGEPMLVTRVFVIDVYDDPREILLLPEAAEELRDALAAALDGQDAPRQNRCGRPKRNGQPCGTPVAREGIACGSHRDKPTVAG